MKKNGILFMFGILLATVLMLSACGSNLSIDTIKSKYKDADYTVKTSSNDDLDKVAGAIEGFSAGKGNQGNYNSMYVQVHVYKFSSQELAEEYIQGTKNASLKNKVYVCLVHSFGSNEQGLSITDSNKEQEAIDLFNGCF